MCILHNVYFLFRNYNYVNLHADDINGDKDFITKKEKTDKN